MITSQTSLQEARRLAARAGQLADGSPREAERSTAAAGAAQAYALLAIAESFAVAVAALVPAGGTGAALEVARLRERVAELETEKADLIRAAGRGLE
jgi:hypothetical protein